MVVIAALMICLGQCFVRYAPVAPSAENRKKGGYARVKAMRTTDQIGRRLPRDLDSGASVAPTPNTDRVVIGDVEAWLHPRRT